MPRRPRSSVLPPHCVVHVTVRGVARQPIVRDDFDRDAIVRGVRDAERRFGWLLYAYCVLDNHFHLVIEAAREHLSRGMHRLNFIYAQRFNRRHDRVGHLFQERFGVRLIEDERYLETACAYVLANAERAGLCEPPARWRWSGGAATANPSRRGRRRHELSGRRSRPSTPRRRRACAPRASLRT